MSDNTDRIEWLRERGTALGCTVKVATDGEWASVTHPDTPEMYAGTIAECYAFVTGWLLARGGRTVAPP